MTSPTTWHPEINLSAVILAGGNSTRFGAPKALAIFSGKSLLEIAISLAQQIAPKIQLSCNDVNVYSRAGLPVIRDANPGTGPLAGITAALEIAETDWVAFIPCDMPLLNRSVYDALLANLGDAPVVAASHRGKEPLVSVWPVSALSRQPFRDALAEQNFALHQLLSALDATFVDMTVALPDYRTQLFANINTPSDLAEIAANFPQPNS